MTVTAIDLFNQIEEYMTAYATKADLKEEIHKLELKIEKVRSDLIKWMFIFWIGQVSVTIALIMLFFK